MKKKLLVCLTCVALALVAVFSYGCSNAAATGIEISSAGSKTEIEVGQTLQLTAKVLPDNASQEVTWRSLDETKATVSATGLVTANAEGNVMISATSVSTPTVSKTFPLVIKKASQQVVTPQTVTLTTPNNITEVKVGETLKITATVGPTGASQEVVWTSSSDTKATVSSNGIVTGVQEGTVTITATAKNADTVKNTIEITVTAAGGGAPSTDYEALPFSTHDEYMAMASSTQAEPHYIKVKGVVTHIIDNGEGKISYYLQNGEDAFYVYQQNSTQFPVTEGEAYAVGGQKTYFRTGAHEIKDVEYCEALSENLSVTTISLNDKDASSKDDMNAYHGAVVSGNATIASAPTVSEKGYNISIVINEKTTTMRVDPANMTEEEFAKINAIFEKAVADVEIEFTGIMTHYGNGTPLPQILIFAATDLSVLEATPAQKVAIAKEALKVMPFVAASQNTITLAASISAYDDVTISWSSSNTDVIANNGAVTHPEDDTLVTLTATVSHNTDNTATDTRTFKVNVAGTAFNRTALVVLDLEDAAAANKNGISETKSGYTEDTITLGTPACQWHLNNTLIGGDGNEHKEGNFALRLQDSAKYGAGRIELITAGDYSYIQFDAAAYGNNKLGLCLKIEYKMKDTDEWIDLGFVISVDSYSLTTYRFAIPEAGDKEVCIYMVQESTGQRVNIDNIKLY